MKKKPHTFEEFLECVIGVSMDHYKHKYEQMGIPGIE